MKRLLLWGLLLPPTYIICWTLAFVLTFLFGGDVPDFRLYFKYLVDSWTFNGFERPTFVWLFSLILFLPVASLVFALAIRRGRQERREMAKLGRPKQ